MKLAIVGIQGLPNNYGGFETLSEYLVKYLGEDLDITVYCSNEVQKMPENTYLGARLKYINMSSHGAKGILYDSIALVNAAYNNFDVILILGFGPGFVMPFLSKSIKKKTILNFGGLDWKRDKWGSFARRIIKLCESLLVKNAAKVISDNKKIQDYIKSTYHKESVLIAYGGDQVTHRQTTNELLSKYSFLGDKYVFEVARIQSDNNIEMLLKAFVKADRYPLVLVGNWKSSEYGLNLKSRYEKEEKLILLDAIYDLTILDVLRSNCYFYVHGHSAGGTNPSLCEAMFLGLPILAYSNGYNQNTTYNRAIYFKDENELVALVQTLPDDTLQHTGVVLKEIAERYYRWSIIADLYKKEFLSIIQ